MKLKILVSLLILSLLSPSLNPFVFSKDDDSEWYPFVIGEKLDPDSPLNIGKLVLDAPAGKHGFVKVKDGHFYFEDGTRAKFWGTNLCFSACFPDKKQAEMLAERIAFFGFNAVRLHHMDYYFEPKGIFEDIAPAYKDPQMKKTTTLSKRQLDKLDYLIFQLKKRGIYVDMNLLVSRNFTEADGVKDADKLGIAAKPASMFNPKLIEFQKKYAKDLLTHYNPYTKLRYCDDPTVALVEITNENSIIESWHWNNLNGNFIGLKKGALANYYLNELDSLWNNWLKEQYGSIDGVKKSWSDSDIRASAPSKVIQNLDDWNIEKHNGAAATMRTVENSAHIDVTSLSKESWHIQFRKVGIPIIRDSNYTLNFTIRADKKKTISVVCQQAFMPFNILGLSKPLEIDEDFQTFEIPFYANDNCANAKIAFILGYSKGPVIIKDVTLVKTNKVGFDELNNAKNFSFTRPLYKLRFMSPKQKIQDAETFYNELEKNYFTTMASFLKNDIGVKVPINGSQYSSIGSQKACDFIDKHAYWDHPTFPNKKWDMNDFRITNKSLILDSNLGIVGNLLKNQPKDEPYTVTEWNHSYPNEYAYETPVILGAEALKNNWDGLFQFAFSHGWEQEPTFDNIHSYFDTITNPQKLILTSLGGLIYLNGGQIETSNNDGIFKINSPILNAAIGFIKDKPITLGPFTTTADQNGALVLFRKDNKYILFAMSEVKNTNSGWNLEGTFRWGKSPVLLKKINIKLQYKNKITLLDFSKSPWTEIVYQ